MPARLRRSDLLGRIRKEKDENRTNFIPDSTTTQGKYYNLKEELDKYKTRYWPENNMHFAANKLI
jgi:hypothetical protein